MAALDPFLGVPSDRPPAADQTAAAARDVIVLLLECDVVVLVELDAPQGAVSLHELEPVRGDLPAGGQDGIDRRGDVVAAEPHLLERALVALHAHIAGDLVNRHDTTCQLPEPLTLPWGEQRMTNMAAAWRDQMLVVLKGSRTRFLKPPKNKTTTGVTGVSRTIKYDHRKDKSYLCYTVFWVNGGKSRNKTFQVGNVEKISADDELHAFRTAKLFRSCYEYAIDYDLPFEDGKFVNWKKTRLYEDPDLIAA